MVFKNGENQLNVEYSFDEKKFDEIARECGSKRVRESVAYLRRAYYLNKSNVLCCEVDECCFFMGTCGSKHFRLLEIAVKEDMQGQGYGDILMTLMKSICKKRGLQKITLRTSKDETAKEFFKKYGGQVVGEKDTDYEMEIRL